MNLRFIERNGKEVLQYYTDGEITNWGVLHGCWTDVPTVRAEPEELTPENKKLVRAVIQEFEKQLMGAEPVQVVEQTVTVTREQIAVAWANSVGERPAVDYIAGRSPMFNDLCKALGFRSDEQEG